MNITVFSREITIFQPKGLELTQLDNLFEIFESREDFEATLA